jgi:hypothetical protein
MPSSLVTKQSRLETEIWTDPPAIVFTAVASEGDLV